MHDGEMLESWQCAGNGQWVSSVHYENNSLIQLFQNCGNYKFDHYFWKIQYGLIIQRAAKYKLAGILTSYITSLIKKISCLVCPAVAAIHDVCSRSMRVYHIPLSITLSGQKHRWWGTTIVRWSLLVVHVLGIPEYEISNIPLHGRYS